MGRTVFVTGGARGIGAAIVRRFEAAGHRVLAPTRAELDLADLDALEAALPEHPGRDADVLVHCAAINPVAPLAELSLADWRRTQDVNLGSAFLLVRALGPRMAARGWGRIVLVSSAYSFLARPGRAAYAASKGGLNALARTAALEFAEAGVLVNAVCPGFVDTDMTRRNNPPEAIARLEASIPLGRLATPEAIADMVHHLGSDANTYVTGQAVVVDGGFSIQ